MQTSQPTFRFTAQTVQWDPRCWMVSVTLDPTCLAVTPGNTWQHLAIGRPHFWMEIHHDSSCNSSTICWVTFCWITRGSYRFMCQKRSTLWYGAHTQFVSPNQAECMESVYRGSLLPLTAHSSSSSASPQIGSPLGWLYVSTEPPNCSCPQKMFPSHSLCSCKMSKSLYNRWGNMKKKSGHPC